MSTEKISIFGSGLFLLVQVIMLLDFSYTWNDSWVEKDDRSGIFALLAISVRMLHSLHLHSRDFSSFGSTLQAKTVVSRFLHPHDHDSCIWICNSCIASSGKRQPLARLCYFGVLQRACCTFALSSEPRDYICNGLHKKSKGVSTSTLILGMLTTILSVMYSAIRAGSSTTFLSPPSSPKSGISQQLRLEQFTIGGFDLIDVGGQRFGFGYALNGS
ncbi:hypothetical protein IFM89_030075 [Coptis chinensis]|uniref:Uncharacterized protein n=1 Tax=Coptis chinensis TaxID=261450 RepID=A0A835ITX3_9MAGN|nr:hypothetical protein IFM89_030075 [Coptis chinensis]